MLIYYHLPLQRILLYLSTILFHGWLLVRSVIGERYIMAALLAIPVLAVSIGLWRFMSKAVIRIKTHGSGLTLNTILGSHNYNPREIIIRKNEIKTNDGKRFLINPAKSETLVRQLNKEHSGLQT